MAKRSKPPSRSRLTKKRTPSKKALTQAFSRLRTPVNKGGNLCIACREPYKSVIQDILREWSKDGYFYLTALYEHLKEVYDIPYNGPSSLQKHLLNHEPLYAKLREKQAQED